MRGFETRLADTRRTVAQVMLQNFVDLACAPLVQTHAGAASDAGVESAAADGAVMVSLAVGLAQLDSLSELLPLIRDRWLSGIKDAVRIRLQAALDALDEEASKSNNLQQSEQHQQLDRQHQADASSILPASSVVKSAAITAQSTTLSLAQRLECLAPHSFLRVLHDLSASLRPWLSRLALIVAWLNAHDAAPDSVFAAAKRVIATQLGPHVSESVKSPSTDGTTVVSDTQPSDLKAPPTVLGVGVSALPVRITLSPALVSLVSPDDDIKSADGASVKFSANARTGRLILAKAAPLVAANPLSVVVGNERACAQLRSEWLELFGAVAEFAHTRCARILDTRKEVWSAPNTLTNTHTRV